MRTIVTWRKDEPFSVNSMTDHMLFCPHCLMRARYLAKSCFFFETISSKIDTNELNQIKEALEPTLADKILELMKISKKMGTLVHEIKLCDRKEKRFSTLAIRKNFLLPFARFSKKN